MTIGNRQKFMTLVNDILADRQGTSTSLSFQTLEGDEADKSNQIKEEKLSQRLEERNLLFLKKVEEAKQKIIDGTYGTCEECECTISQKRLLARPTAKLCIDCQEEKEKTDFNNFNKRRDLNTKTLSSDNNDGYIKERETFTRVSDIKFESVVDL